MSTTRYLNHIDGTIVSAIRYDGTNYPEVGKFTGLRPHDIYEVAPGLFGCAITPIRNGHYQPKIVLTPGLWIVKDEANGLRTYSDIDFKTWFRDPIEKVVDHE